MTAACAGQWELFDSIHPADHFQAAAICGPCPVYDWCVELRDGLRSGGAVAASSLTGTWAGRLYGISSRQRKWLYNTLREMEKTA